MLQEPGLCPRGSRAGPRSGPSLLPRARHWGSPMAEAKVGSPPTGLDQWGPQLPSRAWGRGKNVSPQKYVAPPGWCLRAEQAGQALSSAQAWGFAACRTLTLCPVPAGLTVLGWWGQAQAGHKDKRLKCPT